MANETNPNIDFWQAAKKLLGGSFFCGLIGAMCNPWMENDSLAVSLIMGGAIGSVLGAYIAMSFEDVYAKTTAILFARHSLQANANPPKVGFARGVILARFVCVFLMPPFLVVGSFALVSMSFVLGVFGNGLDGGIDSAIELAQGLYWFIGLYFSFAFLVAAGSWIVQGVCRGRIHAREQSAQTLK